MKTLIFSILFSFVLGASGVMAMPLKGCGGTCNKCHSLTVKEANSLLRGLGGEVKQVKDPPVRGLWEVDLEKGGKKAVAYVDYGKKYIIPGAIYNIATRTPIAMEESKPAAVARVKAGSIPLSNSIIMGNPKGKKRLFVFTDPECPFCARLHGELKKLTATDHDLAVYVKLFPLKMHPHAYEKAKSIIQGHSPKLLDEAFRGIPLPEAGPQAAKEVDESIMLGRSIGVTATPTLVFPDGRVIPGYRDAASIEKLLSAGKGGKGR